MISDLKGLSAGALGLLEPRSDVFLYSLDNISEFSSQCGIDPFTFFKYHVRHEFYQRAHYADPPILAIKVLFDIIKSYIERKKSLDENDKVLLRLAITRMYNIMRDFDLVFDAFFSVTTYDKYNKVVDVDLLSKFIVANIGDKSAQEEFERLFNIYKLSGKDIEVVNYILTGCITPYPSLMLLDKEIRIIEIFHGMIAAFAGLFEKDPENAKQVVSEIRSNRKGENPQQELEFVLLQLHKHFPILDLLLKPQDQDPSEIALYNNVKRELRLDPETKSVKDYLRLTQEGPVIVIEEKNGKYRLICKEQNLQVAKAARNLSISYALDLVWKGRDPSCILCQVGLRHHDNFIHNEVEFIKDKIKQVYEQAETRTHR